MHYFDKFAKAKISAKCFSDTSILDPKPVGVDMILFQY